MKLLKELIEEENIRSVEELFTKHPEVWTKGYANKGYRRADGELTFEFDLACYGCLVSAVQAVHEYVYDKDGTAVVCCANLAAYENLRLAITDNMPETLIDIAPRNEVVLPIWNDRMERSFDEVLKAVKLAKV